MKTALNAVAGVLLVSISITMFFLIWDFGNELWVKVIASEVWLLFICYILNNILNQQIKK